MLQFLNKQEIVLLKKKNTAKSVKVEIAMDLVGF